MTVDGYMVQADWDGSTLVVRGTNKAGRVALLGEDHAAGEVSIRGGDIARVELKDASRLVNGNLVVHTTAGRKYQLHFRRKSQEEFTALRESLLEASLA